MGQGRGGGARSVGVECEEGVEGGGGGEDSDVGGVPRAGGE